MFFLFIFQTWKSNLLIHLGNVFTWLRWCLFKNVGIIFITWPHEALVEVWCLVLYCFCDISGVLDQKKKLAHTHHKIHIILQLRLVHFHENTLFDNDDKRNESSEEFKMWQINQNENILQIHRQTMVRHISKMTLFSFKFWSSLNHLCMLQKNNLAISRMIKWLCSSCFDMWCKM